MKETIVNFIKRKRRYFLSLPMETDLSKRRKIKRKKNALVRNRDR